MAGEEEEGLHVGKVRNHEGRLQVLMKEDGRSRKWVNASNFSFKLTHHDLLTVEDNTQYVFTCKVQGNGKTFRVCLSREDLDTNKGLLEKIKSAKKKTLVQH